MKKLIVVVFAFVISSAFLFLSDTQYFSNWQKTGIVVLEAIVFQIVLMDKSFFKKEKRAELRKIIED